MLGNKKKAYSTEYNENTNMVDVDKINKLLVIKYLRLDCIENNIM